MLKAVIYARYSSDRQTEQSISGQLTVCYEYAKKNDIMVVGEYIDRAYTGMNDERPEFQRMLKDSNKKQWDYVLVYKLDRFSRNRYDSAIHNKTLKKNNAKLISASENISDSPEGVLMESLLTGMSEYYSLELSQKINRGLNENIKKGLMVGGSVTWGYDMLNKKLVINDETADNVRFIFNSYLEGKTMDEIIDILNQRGIMNVNGKPFSHQHISKLLHNKRYIGVFKYKGVEHENYITPIIDYETFSKVQAKLVGYKNYGKRKSDFTFYLTGKLFCGHCGKSMGGISAIGKNKNVRYAYYACSNKDKKAEPKVELEELVTSVIGQMILQAPYRDELIDNIIDLANKTELHMTQEIDVIKRSAVSTRKKLNNLLNAVKMGIVSDTLQAELTALEQQLQMYELEIAKKKSVRNLSIDPEKVIYFFDKLVKYQMTEEGRGFIIKHFVKSVTVFDDKITIETELMGDRHIKTYEKDAQGVSLGATQFHHNQRNTNTIGFKEPKIYIFRFSIFIVVSRIDKQKKEA